MKTNFKNIALILGLSFSIFSCTPNDPVDPNDPNGNTGKALDLISIRSTNMPSGNNCNLWDLNTSNSATPGLFTNLRSSDFITSTAGLLGQTTMSYNTSAWDKINKKYAVAIKESVTIYDLSGGSVPAPTTYITNVESMEYVGGTLYVIRNNKLMKESGGTFVALSTPVTLSMLPSDHVSSMTTNGTDLFFIVGNKYYQYSTTGTLINSFTLSSTQYDGVEFNSADSRIYAIKKHAYPATQDELVRITSSTETSILTLGYATDYSKATTAYDYNTGKYIIFSSNGHSSNSYTITVVSNLTTVPSATVITTTGSQYVFGVQIKD